MNHSYNFDELPPRRQTNSYKWDHYDQDVLPLWVADMDFRSPEPVIRALRDRVEHSVFGYPDALDGKPQEQLALRQVIVERMAERYGWRIEPQEIVFLPGVITGFNLACHALAVPQGEVLVQTPVYPPILKAPQNANMIRTDLEICPDQNGCYQINQEEFASAFTPQSRLFILCNPHNPLGRVFTREELEWMAETCLKNDVVICSDEIHCDLIYPGRQHIPIASLHPEIAANTITLMAPSKTFNIAGLKFSFAIIQNDVLRRRYQQSGGGLVDWINIMGWVAAEAAYRHGQDWLDNLLVYLQANRDFLSSYITRELPGVKMAKPEGTYLAWLDCRQAIADGDPYRYFLEKARVALYDGRRFGKGGDGFVRFNFGSPRFMLVEALQRMQRALVE